MIGKTETKNGITYKINEDCSITVNGTPTDYTSFNLLDMSLKAGTYKFTDGLNTNNVFLQSLGDFSDTSQNRTFSLAEDGNATLYLVILEGTPTLNNVTLYPMIHEGTEDKPYEQYGASPSPNYPSEVETVGSNVNELDIKNIIVGGLVNGNIVSNTISRLVTKEPIPVKSSTAYNINFNELGEFKGVRIGIHSLDSEGNFLKDSGWLNFSATKQITYTTAENCKSIRIVFSFSKTAQTVTTNTEYTEKIILDDFYNMKFKLEKGLIATPYSTYGTGSVEIDVVNENLFPSVKSQSVENNGITLSYNADTQEFHAEGTTTSTNFYCTLQWKEMKNLKADKNYTMSITNKTPKNCAVQLLKPRNGFNANIAGTNTKSRMERLDKFKPDTIMFYATDIEVGTQIDYTFKVQIEEGITSTNIVDHQSQTAIMPIQQEMLEGDYVSNVEHHEWKKLVLTGDEEWTKGYDSERTNGFQAEIEELRKIDKTQNYVLCGALCNYLKESLFFTNDISKEVWGNLNTFALSLSAQYTLALNIGNINTVEELKSFLKAKYDEGNPVTVYYKLAEPLNLELTAEQKAIRDTKLYTYKNITNISVDNELASIEVEYKKDLDAEHNKLQAEDNNLQSQIDEIKQLLSTTQTSALLLDNLQKDVESEVE